MDRLRIWIESRQSGNGNDDGPFISFCRPPPLRTSNTYDDDDAFTNVSLNLLSRQNGLGLSPIETIISTLISPKQRASYYDGLCTRMDRFMHLTPNMASIVQSIEKVFGTELRSMIEQEWNHCKGSYPSYQKPLAPRHVQIVPATSSELSTSSSSTRSKSSSHQKRKKSRRFFPDGSDHTNNSMMSKSSLTVTTTSNGFFRNKARIQNIDWKLVQAIQQVESLRLDGDDCTPVGTKSTPSKNCSYQPPSYRNHSSTTN